MPQTAKVQSIDAIRAFRITLLKFADAADSALADAEGEMSHTLMWLQTEQPAHWRTQVRKRSEILTRAKEALRMKCLYKDSSGHTPSADQEQKAVQLATRRLEEAEEKVQTVKKWERRLQKEISSYQGSARRLATQIQSDLPRAAAQLDQTIQQLEAYVSLTGAPEDQFVESTAPSSMTRPPAASGESIADEDKTPDEHQETPPQQPPTADN
jgi:hypothetical protein